jgi:hypothetical protein
MLLLTVIAMPASLPLGAKFNAMHVYLPSESFVDFWGPYGLTQNLAFV